MKHLRGALLIFVLVPLLAQAAELQFGVGDFGNSTGRRKIYVSGQQAQLSVRVVRGGGEKYLGLPYYPPAGLKIYAGTNSVAGFMQDAAWTHDLNLVHYVDRYRLRADSLYRTKGTPVDVDGEQSNLGEIYQFTFTVPDAPRDGKVCLRAVYDHSEFGHLEADIQCINVVRAQTEDDTRLIWSSLINAAYARSDARRVIALADSFMATGFVDPDWADLAKTVAYENGNYRKALEYLEANWEVNGISSSGQLQQWRGQRVADTERRQKDYDRQHKDLLTKLGQK
ncbi:MAG TPA: hypothetical protein VGL38_10830 [bacterium]|jgi:hypothetical protein